MRFISTIASDRSRDREGALVIPNRTYETCTYQET